jgi:hypothetical protein
MRRRSRLTSVSTLAHGDERVAAPDLRQQRSRLNTMAGVAGQ